MLKPPVPFSALPSVVQDGLGSWVEVSRGHMRPGRVPTVPMPTCPAAHRTLHRTRHTHTPQVNNNNTRQPASPTIMLVGAPETYPGCASRWAHQLPPL